MKFIKIITGYFFFELVFKKESKISLFIVWLISLGILSNLFHNEILGLLSPELSNYTDYYMNKPIYIVTDIIVIFSLCFTQILSLILGIFGIEMSYGFLEVFFTYMEMMNEAIVNVLTEVPYIGATIINFSWLYFYLGLFIYIVVIVLKKFFRFAIKTSVVVIVILIVVSFFNQMNLYNSYQNMKYLSEDHYTNAKVIDVVYLDTVDGDTAKFMINDEEITIRFLYVDTPEVGSNAEPYGYEASLFTRTLLENAEEIVIEYDGERFDKYERTLAWIWIDGVLLQEALTKKGYVEKFYDYGDYKYEDLLYTALEYAKRKQLGIYSD